MNKLIKKIDSGGRTGTPGSYTYDNTKVEAYAYFANGDLKSKIDRNGKTTNYVYDCHHQMLSQTIGTSTISYTYDNNGNQRKITDSTGTTERFYDELNRVTAKTVPNFGTTNYAYDITTGLPAGYVAETTTDYKGNLKKTVYDKAGRIYQVIADGKTTTYNYYGNGNKMNVTYNDNTKQEYTYYKDSLLFTLVTKKPDSSIMDSYSYTYDDAHNQLTKYEKINGVEKGTTTNTYDELNRLKTVTEPGASGKVTTYTYDAAGNRETETVAQGTNNTQTVYAYNNQNRLMSTTKTQSNGAVDIIKYNYDNNGNLISKGEEAIKAYDPQDNSSYGLFVVGQSLDGFSTSMGLYEYDDWNQLVSATTGDQTEAYVYNGEGYRVQKTTNGQTTRFLYEYDKVILETGTDGTQKAWNVYGTNLISRKMNSDTAFYIYNGHGDVTALLNASGSVIATYYYDAFGNILEKNENAGISNPFKYSGYQFDDQSGLYYLNTRYYDSVTARFITEDDTKYSKKNNPLTLNLYSYCQNNPISYIDPTGHTLESIIWKNIVDMNPHHKDNFEDILNGLRLGDPISGLLPSGISEFAESGEISKGTSDIMSPVIPSGIPGGRKLRKVQAYIPGSAIPIKVPNYVPGSVKTNNLPYYINKNTIKIGSNLRYNYKPDKNYPLNNPEFVAIHDGNTTYFGGNQAWFVSDSMQNTGCGTVAAADILAYMALCYPWIYGNLYPYDLDYISQIDFLNFMNDISKYVTPEKWGVLPSEFINGVIEYARSRGIELETKIITSNATLSAVKDFIMGALQDNQPVAFLDYLNPITINGIDSLNNQPYSIDQDLHWVVITGMTVNKITGNVTLEISTWGDKATVSLNQLYDNINMINKFLNTQFPSTFIYFTGKTI